ncbi:MarR family winged helix-turn-helix transcriptional regulator [Streptomyces africanus]|uniref:MarR family winged helix-turn-helix transcriptional regulator n=1 Tax=Streptomyces africanus TaxID=231024 RepID=UPI001FC98CD1|nr:MarR family winged helix-turn-helix transcriptional regulator [Streptomyces africanus]
MRWAGRIKNPRTRRSAPEASIATPQTPQYLADSPLHLLRRALQSYTARWQEAVGDVTPPQYSVLLTVHAYPGIDQSRLGVTTGIDPATLAPLVQRLELRGLLAREVDPANRRRKLLTLTEDGMTTVDRIRPLADVVDDAVLGDLPDTQRAALVEALRWISGIGRTPD